MTCWTGAASRSVIWQLVGTRSWSGWWSIRRLHMGNGQALVLGDQATDGGGQIRR
jgi:hypothetical protein